MTDLDSGVRVLSFADPLLSPAALARLAPALSGERDGCAIVIDCSALSTVTPAGLTALLELGRTTAAPGALALAGLSRALTLAAVQAGLAEHFAIYANVAAFTRARERDETSPCAR